MSDVDSNESPAASNSDLPPTVSLVLNGASYVVEQSAMTAAALRQIPFPAIPSHFDLWLERTGGTDAYVRDDEVIQLEDGMRIYTAPRSIMAGVETYSSAGALEGPARRTDGNR